MTDAFVSFGDRGFPADDGEYVSLRASINARTTAYAVIHVDVRMLCPGSFRDQAAAGCRSSSLAVATVHTPNLGDNRESEDRQ